MKKILSALCLLISIQSFAQHTGMYDSTITFQGAQREIVIYAPTNYNSANSYHLMVMLHGLGEPVDDYSSALINTNQWDIEYYFPNTIFIFPEVHDLDYDYYYPTGGEQIIQKCIDIAKGVYNIDTSNIVLQGFSIGGRDALRYGLDHYSQFKGLLLNTPAVQGVKEALNLSSTFNFTYQNASHLPIYMTHGTLDTTYQNIDDSVYNQLVLNDGIVRYFQFPIGHTIPAFQQIQHIGTFFDTTTSPNGDIDVVNIITTSRTCNTSIPALCLIRNVGRDTVHTVKLSYTVNGNMQNYVWTGSLSSFQHAIVTLPDLTAVAGNETVSISVDTLNDSVANSSYYTNENTQLVNSFKVVSNGQSVPYFEGFEEPAFPPPGWVAISDGDYEPGVYGWFPNPGVAASGNNSMLCYNNLFMFEDVGRQQQMLTPVLDLTSLQSPNLNFDVAYYYIEYTSQYEPYTGVYADTLDVSISTDCGSTYQSLFHKGGTDLLTFTSDNINPLTEDAALTFPSALAYMPISIDLSNYSSSNEAVIKFSYISDQGGAISIDNVGVADTALSIKQVKVINTIRIYPNPATNMVNVASENGEQINKVNVVNVTGEIVINLTNLNTSQLSVNISNLPAGIYFFEVVTNTRSYTDKVLIEK